MLAMRLNSASDRWNSVFSGASGARSGPRNVPDPASTSSVSSLSNACTSASSGVCRNRSAHRRTVADSMILRTANRSAASSAFIRVTVTPAYARDSTKPSISSCLRASRTGTRETSYAPHSRDSVSRSPGG